MGHVGRVKVFRAAEVSRGLEVRALDEVGLVAEAVVKASGVLKPTLSQTRIRNSFTNERPFKIWMEPFG